MTSTARIGNSGRAEVRPDHRCCLRRAGGGWAPPPRGGGAGPPFAEDGRGFLACADTLADDRAATALAVADAFRLLSATGATVRFLLDAPGLSEDELADLFPAAGPHVALTATEADQPS